MVKKARPTITKRTCTIQVFIDSRDKNHSDQKELECSTSSQLSLFSRSLDKSTSPSAPANKEAKARVDQSSISKHRLPVSLHSAQCLFGKPQADRSYQPHCHQTKFSKPRLPVRTRASIQPVTVCSTSGSLAVSTSLQSHKVRVQENTRK